MVVSAGSPTQQAGSAAQEGPSSASATSATQHRLRFFHKCRCPHLCDLGNIDRYQVQGGVLEASCGETIMVVLVRYQIDSTHEGNTLAAMPREGRRVCLPTNKSSPYAVKTVVVPASQVMDIMGQSLLHQPELMDDQGCKLLAGPDVGADGEVAVTPLEHAGIAHLDNFVLQVPTSSLVNCLADTGPSGRIVDGMEDVVPQSLELCVMVQLLKRGEHGDKAYHAFNMPHLVSRPFQVMPRSFFLQHSPSFPAYTPRSQAQVQHQLQFARQLNMQPLTHQQQLYYHQQQQPLSARQLSATRSAGSGMQAMQPVPPLRRTSSTSSSRIPQRARRDPQLPASSDLEGDEAELLAQLQAGTPALNVPSILAAGHQLPQSGTPASASGMRSRHVSLNAGPMRSGTHTLFAGMPASAIGPSYLGEGCLDEAEEEGVACKRVRSTSMCGPSGAPTPRNSEPALPRTSYASSIGNSDLAQAFAIFQASCSSVPGRSEESIAELSGYLSGPSASSAYGGLFSGASTSSAQTASTMQFMRDNMLPHFRQASYSAPLRTHEVQAHGRQPHLDEALLRMLNQSTDAVEESLDGMDMHVLAGGPLPGPHQ